MKNYTKPIIYSLSALIYLDIFLNPNKGFSFLKINNNILSIVAFIVLMSLIFLVYTLVSGKLQKFSKLGAIIFLSTSLLIINEFLFSYSFLQPVHFLVTFLLIAPVPLIINDLLNLKKSKTIELFMIFGSLMLMSATLIFFFFFYTPYEDYFAGIPIIFIHHWIRNWLIVTSIILLSLGILKKTTATGRQANYADFR